MYWLTDMFELLIPIVGIVATFTFVGLIIWAKHRQSERQAYYRHELVKQMAEKGGDQDQLVAFLREEARLRQVGRRRGLILGGLVVLAVGLGHMFAFRFVAEDIWALGAVPALIGVALLIGGLLFKSAEQETT